MVVCASLAYQKIDALAQLLRFEFESQVDT